jgi:hypothetical protein
MNMKCPNCHEEMVEGECGDSQSTGTDNTGMWARPLDHDFWGNPHTRVARRMKVCHHCGLMLMFVKDPSIFRPKTGTETLPRSASEPELSTETLPRAAGESESSTETLPRPADKE